MTTTQYTPGTIIVHEYEAHRILQINDKGHARTISDNALELIINTNTLNPETTKVITNATPETWINYITKAHTARYINKELTRDQYKTESHNALARYRKVSNHEAVPTISLLDESNSRAAVKSYLENIIASINEGKSKMEALHAEFLVTVPAILAEDPKPEFSIPEPDMDFTVIKGYKFDIGKMYHFDVNVPAKEPEYRGDTERVRRYAKISRVTKTRAYLTFEDGSDGYVATAGSKSMYELAVTIGEESYTVNYLGGYLTDTIEGIQEIVPYSKTRKDVAYKIGDTYSKIVSETIDANPFWEGIFSTWAHRGRIAESAINNAVGNLTNSMNTVAEVTAPINNLLEQLAVFEH